MAPVMVFSITHTFTMQNKSNLLYYFKISSDITLLSLYIIMVSFLQPKLHNVNTNLKLWLQGNVGTKCSHVKFGKTLTLRQNMYLFVWGFGWDNRNEPKMWGYLKLRFCCNCIWGCFKNGAWKCTWRICGFMCGM